MVDWNGVLESFDSTLYRFLNMLHCAFALYCKYTWLPCACIILGLRLVRTVSRRSVARLSITIQMALEGSSKSNPIYLSDSSPASVPVSPVKLLREKGKKDQCR